MEDVLPADAAEVPPERANKLEDIDIAAEVREYRFRDRIKARRAFHLKQRKLKRSQARSNAGTFEGRYRYKKKWLMRKADLDPAAIAKRLENDQELQRLRLMLRAPRSGIRTKMSRAFYAAESPRIIAKMQAIQAELEPHINAVIHLDRKMRHQLGELEFIRFRSRRILAPLQRQIQAKIAMRIKRITIGMARQKVETDRHKLRKSQGFWGYIEKKFAPLKPKRVRKRRKAPPS